MSALPDRRLNAYRPDLAESRLRGVVQAERYVERTAARLELGRDSLVMEIASNDGYLLQYVAARGIPCIGIEPTTGTANVARQKGIETLERFFGRDFATEFVRERRTADLIVANNVLAHVPDINDFVAGLVLALAAEGSITVEFPHLMELVAKHQFDTVYHEHFSYLSLYSVQRILEAAGLRIHDVEELTTHGGSLRVHASHQQDERARSAAVPLGRTRLSRVPSDPTRSPTTSRRRRGASAYPSPGYEPSWVRKAPAIRARSRPRAPGV